MKRTSAEIISAEPADAPALAALIRAFRDHLRASSPSDAELEQALPRVLADPEAEFRCAWQDGRAVGYTQLRFFASVWAPGTEANLEDLFVLASARGRGIGCAMRSPAPSCGGHAASR